MKKVSGILIISITFLLIGLLSGCNIAKEKGETEAVVTEFYENIKNREYENSMSFYSDKFFEKVKKDEWKNSLELLNKKLGNLESYKLEGWKVNKQVGTGNSGTYYSLQYTVKYSKYSAIENLTLFKPAGKEEIKILGHHINSDGLLKE